MGRVGRFVDDQVRSEAKTISLARGTILLAREDKVRRLPIREIVQPTFPACEGFDWFRGISAPGSRWRFGLADR